MTSPEVYQRIKERLPDAAVEENLQAKDPYLKVKPEKLKEVCRFLKEHPDLRFDLLHCISGVDYGKDLGCVYHIESTTHRHKAVIKVDLPRGNPEVDTVEDLWKAANWHEREAFDLLGIVFRGHPNLVRILCAEDWEGHPLRKDYVFPTEYHDIVCEFDTANKEVAARKK